MASPETALIKERAELLTALRAKAVIYGKRTLASGSVSHYYIDGKQVSLDGRSAFLIGQLVLELIRPLKPTAFGGPTLGADPITGAVIAEAARQGFPLKGFIVRKDVKGHGTSKLIEGPALGPGDRAVLVEDVITTGGSVKKAVDAVQAAGAKVIQIVALVDRQEGALEALAMYNYTPLFSKSDLQIKSSF